MPLLPVKDVCAVIMPLSARRQLRQAGFTCGFLSRRVGFELCDLVEGGYTAKEFRVADYDATTLKALGFTAAALRVGGFTSRQMHLARYKLKDMQEGGVPWQDLGASAAGNISKHVPPPSACAWVVHAACVCH